MLPGRIYEVVRSTFDLGLFSLTMLSGSFDEFFHSRKGVSKLLLILELRGCPSTNQQNILFSIKGFVSRIGVKGSFEWANSVLSVIL